jgi:uncharacterized protein
VDQGHSTSITVSEQLPAIKRRNFARKKSVCPPRHWVGNDAFATAFFNCLSVVFPEGEAFMIRTVSTFKGQIPEPLNTAVEDFIYQEAGHSREHVAANRVITQSGYDITQLEASIRKVVDRLQNMGPIGALCGTMCIEHLTSIIAAEILEGDHLSDADTDLSAFWKWHALEEIEHKAVAFDLWHYATRDWSPLRRWAMRCSFMATIASTFLYNRTQGQLRLLRQDGIGTLSALRGMFAYGFRKGGIGRNILRPLVQFFRPGFHPWQIDDRHLIAKGEAMIAEQSKTKTIDKSGERRSQPRFKKAA